MWTLLGLGRQRQEERSLLSVWTPGVKTWVSSIAQCHLTRKYIMNKYQYSVPWQVVSTSLHNLPPLQNKSVSMLTIFTVLGYCFAISLLSTKSVLTVYLEVLEFSPVCCQGLNATHTLVIWLARSLDAFREQSNINAVYLFGCCCFLNLVYYVLRHFLAAPFFCSWEWIRL